MAISTQGITLSHKVLTVLTPIGNLLEIPELGGKVDKIEVTTLADTSKKYIAGIKDFGDLEFKFIYENDTATSCYRVLKEMETSGAIEEFVITFPDNTLFTFSGSVTTTIDSGKVGDAITFSASLTLSSDIVPTNPTA